MTIYQRKSTLAAPVLCALLAGGCITQEPPPAEQLTAGALPEGTKVPGQYAAPGQTAGSEAPGGWLKTFNDPKLEALVAEALTNNRDLAAGKARVDRAAAEARQAGADLMPQVGYSLNAATGGQGGSSARTDKMGAGLTLSWELDVWGRLASGRDAVREAFASQEADFAYARQSLVAQVAKAYFLLIQAVRQEAIAREFVEINKRTVALVQLRKQFGTMNAFDLALQRSSLASSEDRLQQARSGREKAARSLEILLGRYPKAEISALPDLPTLPPAPPAGLPASLLERRPDLVAATRRIAAAFDQKESAKAARLPRLSITADGGALADGFRNMALDDLFWNVGANFLGPIFDGGRLREQVEIADAKQREALALFGKAALQAFREVETTLTEGARLEIRRDLVAAADRDQTEALKLANMRLDEGLIDQVALLNVQSGTLNARLAALAVEVERLTNRVDLHLALGGDYASTEPAPETPSAQ